MFKKVYAHFIIHELKLWNYHKWNSDVETNFFDYGFNKKSLHKSMLVLNHDQKVDFFFGLELIDCIDNFIVGNIVEQCLGAQNFFKALLLPFLFRGQCISCGYMKHIYL